MDKELKGGAFENGKKTFVQKHASWDAVGNGSKHKTGPNLHGLFGWMTGQAAVFTYLDANTNKGITWERIHWDYLQNPKKDVPRAKMIFAEMKKGRKRRPHSLFLKGYYYYEYPLPYYESYVS